jgi:hypothetical protein
MNEDNLSKSNVENDNVGGETRTLGWGGIGPASGDKFGGRGKSTTDREKAKG